jgi:hypothetical protein
MLHATLHSMLHPALRAVLHADLRVRSGCATHLSWIGVRCRHGDAEAQRSDHTRYDFVRLFHDRFLSVVEISNLDRLPVPADSGGGSGLSKRD